GFPNSFLQAGKYGVPIVSLNVDPDGMLTEHGAGICCHGSLEMMVQSLIGAIGRGADYDRMSDRARRYVQQHHELARCTEQLAALLCEIACRPAAGDSRHTYGMRRGRSVAQA